MEQSVYRWLRKIGSREWHCGWLICWVGLFCWGCAVSSDASKSPHPTPPINLTMSYNSGTTLTGPMPIDVNTLRIEDTYTIQVRVFALAEVPPRIYDSLQKHVRLVMMSPRANFIAPVTRLTPGARVALTDVKESLLDKIDEGLWGTTVPVSEAKGILPSYVTVLFDLHSAVETSVRGNRLRLLLARRDTLDPNDPNIISKKLEIALIRSGRIPPSAELQLLGVEQIKIPDKEPDLVTERVVLMPVALEERQHYVLLIPFAWESPWAGALGLFITLEPFPSGPPEAAQLDMFARCVDSLMRQQAANAAVHGDSNTWAGCLLALDQLIWASHWRRALVYLTSTTQAALAHDIALAAPLHVAQTLARDIYQANETQKAEGRETLAWLIERAAYQRLLDYAKRDLLSPALETLLLRHAGQLGRQIPTLREQLAEARDGDDFERRLAYENRISLEDMSPAARSRAYKWLQAHGQAPPEYDPLASAKERRAALRRANETGD